MFRGEIQNRNRTKSLVRNTLDKEESLCFGIMVDRLYKVRPDSHVQSENNLNNCPRLTLPSPLAFLIISQRDEDFLIFCCLFQLLLAHHVIFIDKAKGKS